MGDEAFEVPLFPLDIVLFPGMALPLHVFEPGYRAMIDRCLDSDLPFGVVRALMEHDTGRDAVARVGTLAQITDYERLPDGRYNLLATGTERFEILDRRHGEPYPTALVRRLCDTAACADEAASGPMSARMDAQIDTRIDARIDALAHTARCALKTYLRTMLLLLGGDECRGEFQITIPMDPAELSFLIGMCLTCEDAEKQALLETRTLAERLQKGTQLLKAETEALANQIEGETHPTRADRSRLN
jgi:Lon protease-like protein